MAGDRFPVRAGQQVLFLVRAGQRASSPVLAR